MYSGNSGISVALATYNGEKYLSEMLTSVVEVNDHRIECIIVDDGSTDNSANIVKSFENELNITFLPLPHAGNWVANANRALIEATGEFVCHLHQDDKWLPNRINVIRALVDRYSDCALYLTAAEFIDYRSQKLGVWHCPLPTFPCLIDGEAVCRALLVQNFVSIPAPIFKRTNAIDVGGLDETLWYTPDWDFWLKLAGKGTVVYDPRPTVAFRVHKESQTITRSRNLEDFQNQLNTVFMRNLHNRSDCSNLAKIIRVGKFSISFNTALAAIAHKSRPKIIDLLWEFVALGPGGWWVYVKYSRIFERVSARIRAQIRNQVQK